MPQEKTIKFTSIAIIKEVDNSLEIIQTTKENYPENTSTPAELQQEPDTYKASIQNEVILQDSIRSLEGELIISQDQETQDFAIDINGDLIVSHENSDRYTINANGELEYTFN